jgi:thymidylate synthase
MYISVNVNLMYLDSRDELLNHGIVVDSRNGKTIELHPHTYGAKDFSQYILSLKGRVLNFPFALAELIWIMTGSDEPWITHYNTQMKNYMDERSPDVFHFNAAYGWRLKYAFGIDQIKNVIHHFRNSIETRHAVMVYSHPLIDSAKIKTKDRACNISSMFLVRDGKLDLTQTVRSHDFVWGLPYNLVQFGYITQYIGEQIDVPVGSLYALSNSFHAYESHWNSLHEIGLNRFEFRDHLDHMKIPIIGKDTSHREIARIEKYIRAAKITNYEMAKEIYDERINNIQSPFWHDGLTVLLSFALRHSPDSSIKVLDLVYSRLFRLMALRYYITYRSKLWGDLSDKTHTVYRHIRDQYGDSAINFVKE